MKTWTEHFPGRLEYELEAFVRRDLDFDLDEAQLEDQGRVVLRGALRHADRELELEVVYPDLFPYLRPEVFLRGPPLERHQNPYAGNLCLLDRSTRAWSPDDTGAWLVAVRVPFLLDLLEAGGDELREAEAPQGEPVSRYFPTTPGAVVFIPASMLELPAEAVAGSGRVTVAAAIPQLRLRGLLTELVKKNPRSRKSRVIARADQLLRDRFGGAELPLRWVRLDGPPADNDPEALLEAIDAAKSGFASPPWREVQGGSLAIAAAVFPEEVRQGEQEDTWLFAVKVRQDHGPDGVYPIRGERLARDDIEARLPSFVRIGEKHASLAGLGALGGPIALELARAGLGTLRGLDFDAVEAGNSVRWVAGLSAVGHLKTDYLSQQLLLDYPHTRFEPFQLQLGGSTVQSTAREETELDVLGRFLEASDLLIDATAEVGIQQALAALADERGLRQLYVSATEGARGGLVACVDPGVGGCWLCLQLRLEDGSIPLPAHAEPHTLQPRGCGSLTYSGAGYDLLPVVAQAARVAIAMLTGNGANGSSAFVCSFEGDERSTPPSWSTHELAPHPDCPLCAKSE